MVVKQKRIRKPKIVEKVDGETNGEEVVKKKRVRKPKAVIEQVQGEEVVVKKGPGRPRKPKPEKIPKKRGRPRKIRPEIPEGAEPPPPKRRGRPRKERTDVVVRVPKKRGPRQKKEPVDPEAKKTYMRNYYHLKKSCYECGYWQDNPITCMHPSRKYCRNSTKRIC